MTLTEQLKKSKIPFGRYYIKDIANDTYIDLYTNNGFITGFEDFADNEISEVLAPVPSYEEWGELHKRLKDTQNLELEVRRENQQLKELLKECYQEISEYLDNDSRLMCILGEMFKNGR